MASVSAAVLYQISCETHILAAGQFSEVILTHEGKEGSCLVILCYYYLI